MPSATYQLLRRAILEGRQVTCIYQDRRREVCPHIIGHTNGEEKLLAYQFGGESSKQLPASGEWRCLDIARIRDARVRYGPWHEGRGHRRRQSCVQEIDLDINVHVRGRLKKP